MTALPTQLNVVMSSLFTADVFASARFAEPVGAEDEEDDQEELAAGGAGGAVAVDAMVHFDERREAELFFSPERGNVVFASAWDGWAFSYVASAGGRRPSHHACRPLPPHQAEPVRRPPRSQPRNPEEAASALPVGRLALQCQSAWPEQVSALR